MNEINYKTRVEKINPPGIDQVEFRIIFSGRDYMEAMLLVQKYDWRVFNEEISKETPLADQLQNLQLLMFRLEQARNSVSPENYTDERHDRTEGGSK